MKKVLCLLFIYSLLITQVLAKDFRFIQVTDVRFDKNAENQTLLSVIEKINSEKNVEFVVFTGDSIVRADQEQLKAFLKQIKKLKRPYYIVIGDKDVNKRKNMSKKDFSKIIKKKGGHYQPKEPNYVIEKKGLVFLVADGAKDVIPSTTGYYKDNVINWIDANLDLYKNKNIIILQHFPIVPPAAKETYYTFKADEYLSVIKKHKNVKAIVAGHFGVNKEEIIDGISHISTAPIPNYRVIDIIDYETDNPTIWSEVK